MTARTIVPVLLAVLISIGTGLGAACIETTDPTDPGECWDHGDCDELQACIDGWCEAIDCLASADCRVGEFCDTVEFICQTGCQATTDCPAGSSCDSEIESCIDAPCTSAIIDCALGEFCNDAGECVSDAEQPECERCDLEGTDECNSGVGYCYHQEKDEEDEAYCRWPCDPQDETSCARGFVCNQFLDGDFYCDAQCGDLTDGGFF